MNGGFVGSNSRQAESSGCELDKIASARPFLRSIVLRALPNCDWNSVTHAKRLKPVPQLTTFSSLAISRISDSKVGRPTRRTAVAAYETSRYATPSSPMQQG
jgi:hypothetical protein